MTKRIVGMLMALVLLSLSLTVPVFSESSSDSSFEGETEGRAYIADRFQTYNMDINIEQSVNCIAFDLRAKDSYLYSQLTPIIGRFPTNAIRLVLQNASACDTIVVTYSYVDETGLLVKDVVKKLAVTPYSPKQSYFVFVGSADTVTEIKLTFEGARRGTIRLYSLYNVSAYEGIPEQPGQIQSLVYNSTTKTITLEGSIQHDVMIRNRNAHVMLYRLEPGESEQDMLNTFRLPLATVPISISFTFSVPAPALEDRLARYVPVLVSADGTKTILTAAAYAYDETVNLSEVGRYTKNGFKGMSTPYTWESLDCGISSTVIDVYLDMLENRQNKGYLYTVDDHYYYFDLNYLKDLDNRIKYYDAMGCKVYLRLLVSASNEPLPYASALATGGVERALMASDEISQRYVYAFVDFLCNRYRSTDRGTISGLILGKQVNAPSVSHDIEAMSLSDYVMRYASTFSIVANTALAANPNMELVVPISDSWNRHRALERYEAGEYLNDVFLESFCRFIKRSNDGRVRFKLMVESEHAPFDFNAESFETQAAHSLTVPENRTHVAADNIEELDSYVEALSASYACMDDSFLFFWTPEPSLSGSALSASYAYTYYRLFVDERAESFIVNFTSRDAIADREKLTSLSYLIKYIDTGKSTDVCKFLPGVFGVNDFESVIGGFDDLFYTSHQLLSREFYEDTPSSVRGNYDLWNFSQSNSVYGWLAGNGCDSVRLGSETTMGRVLRATFQNTSAYSEVVYAFPYPEYLAIGDCLETTFAIEADDPSALFEIRVMLGGTAAELEAREVVTAGEITTLGLDINAFSALNATQYIRIGVKCITGDVMSYDLKLGRISLLSKTYDDGELAEKVTEERERMKNEVLGIEEEKHGSTVSWYVLVAVLALTVLILFFLGKKDTSDS